MSIDSPASSESVGRDGRAEGVLALSSERYAASYVGPTERCGMVGSKGEAVALDVISVSLIYILMMVKCARASMHTVIREWRVTNVRIFIEMTRTYEVHEYMGARAHKSILPLQVNAAYPGAARVRAMLLLKTPFFSLNVSPPSPFAHAHPSEVTASVDFDVLPLPLHRSSE